MATVSAPSEAADGDLDDRHFLLRDIDWQTYRTISRALEGRHVHLAYDKGSLELMTISRSHGNYSRLLGRFVFVLAEEFDLPINSCGDMTCDRDDLERGLEPDECFYIHNEPRIHEKVDIDLAVDPPPDLALEIDISRSSLNRLTIYAAMRVPQVWQFNGTSLLGWQLGADDQYVQCDQSQYFPGLPSSDLAQFLTRRGEMDEVSLVRLFRDWVRGQLNKN